MATIQTLEPDLVKRLENLAIQSSNANSRLGLARKLLAASREVRATVDARTVDGTVQKEDRYWTFFHAKANKLRDRAKTLSLEVEVGLPDTYKAEEVLKRNSERVRTIAIILEDCY